jgi:hypothetical protein
MRLGIDKQATLLAVFFVFAASASGQTGRNYKFHLDGNVQKSEVKSDNQTIIINYSISEINIESITNNAGTFYRASIPGHIPSSNPGKPEVPVFSRLISVPDGSGFKVKISEVRSTRIVPSRRKIKGLLIPAQESETKSFQQNRTRFAIDKSIYATSGIISADTVRIVSLGTMRENKLANLYITPVRYNPRANSIEVITSMKIEITFSNSLNTKSKSLSAPSELINQTLDKGILNFNTGQVIPGYSDQPVKMIILTDTAFRKQLAPFIRWKTQKGFRIKVFYKGTGPAGSTYVQLKDSLTRIYNASSLNDPAPEYLLIIGDVKRIPSYGTGETGNITDMYYGEFDGNNDYIPEMYIGRLPVADTTELKTVVNKIIQYEKFQFADTNKFYSRAVASAGYDAGYSNYMNGQIKYLTTNYLTPANNIQEYHFNYPQSYTSKDSIIILINKGVSFINYTGHGDALGWLHVNIKTPDVQSLNNKNKYPFIISNACGTAQFNLATNFGSRMMLTADKGAIGFIGCSNDSYWDEDFYWAVGPGIISSEPTYDGKGLGALDRLFHTHGESPSDWYFTMGQINYAGNLAVSASNSQRKKYYWETYNLIGDPSVTPIIGKPGTFNISLPDTLPNGIKSLLLNVDPFAYVAISHYDTLWDASHSSKSGAVVLDLPGRSNDSCLIVISGQNKLPMMKTIYFSKINKEFINLSASSINDSEGNNNNMADYGESIYLKLTLSNLGLTDAQNLYAKISSASDLVTITQDSAYVGTLAAGSEFILSNGLGLNISENVPDMEVITVNLILKDGISEKHYTIDIIAHSPELQILNCVLDDKQDGNGNNVPDPGETFNMIFRIHNQGTSNISGQFSISSTDNDISILNPSVKSGVLKFGGITDIPVQIKLSQSASDGTLVTVSALLDCNPYIVKKDFSFKVGKIRESFEASSFNIFPWINVSAVPWTITSSTSYDGILAARSGAIPNGSSTSLIIKPIYSKDDSLRFFYKVSSEINYDHLTFRLNGVEVFNKSGEIPWTKKTVPVKAGQNIMEWIYEKDGSQYTGSDCAWIDLIDFTGSASVKYIQKDLQVARIETPIKKDRFGQGTVSVKILNTGKDTINGFNLAYEINNRVTATKEVFQNRIYPMSDSVTISFKTKTDLSKLGRYDLMVYGYENNDDYPLNDTLRIGMNNTETNDSLIIYPNPFVSHFTVFINSRTTEQLHISINNLSGIKLFDIQKEILAGKNTITISVPGLLPALYYLNIQGTVINKTVRILKLNK